MKISSANNLPEEQGGSSQGSLIDTNSISGDSDLDAASAAGDQNQMIEELKKTIKGNHSQISELEGKLKVTEIQLECQKDKVKDKDEVIRVLQNSIDLITKTSELAIKQLQKSEAGIVTCNNAYNLQKENDSLESIDKIKSKVKENDVDNFGAQLQEIECQAKEDSADSHEVDDNLEKFQEQLDKCKEQNESLDLKNSQLKVELDELKSKMIESQKIEEKFQEQLDKCKVQNKSLELNNSQMKLELDELKSKIIKSKKIEEGLRKKVSELELELKESSEKLAEYSLNIDSSPDNQEIVPLNNTKNPKVKVIEGNGLEPFISVIEDIPSAGSGWIVIQRRIDGKSKFVSLYLSDFENGFGDIRASFWLGLNLIHKLTTSQRHELYIQVRDCDGVTAYARYDHFEIGNKEEKYKIKSLGSYSGNAGDAFRSLENAPLRSWESGNSSYYWWGGTAMNCNLNGTYNTPQKYGFYWGRLSLGNKECLLKSCQMLIRPKIK